MFSKPKPPCESCAAHTLIENSLKETVERLEGELAASFTRYEELLRSHLAIADRAAYIVRYAVPRAAGGPSQDQPVTSAPRTSPAALRAQVYKPGPPDEKGMPQGASPFGVVAKPGVPEQYPVPVTEADFKMPERA